MAAASGPSAGVAQAVSDDLRSGFRPAAKDRGARGRSPGNAPIGWPLPLVERLRLVAVGSRFRAVGPVGLVGPRQLAAASGVGMLADNPDLHPDQPLDVAQVLALLAVAERDCDARRARPRGASDAVHVTLRKIR